MFKGKWSNRVALTVALLAAPPLHAQTIDTIAMRAHTRFLASDLLEGRGTGTRGESVAAAYIIAELLRIGAQPAHGNTFLQPIPLKSAIIDHTGTSATLNDSTYRSERDFVWNVGGRQALRSFTGPLIYVGSADSVALRRVDEVRGRVALVAGALGSAASTYIPALIKAGAAGAVLLASDQANFDLYVRTRGDARLFLDAEVDDPVWQADLPVIVASPRLRRALIGNSPPARFTDIDDTLAVTFKARFEDMRSANIAAQIRGADPSLAAEYVAYSAHYDHLGISLPDTRGDSIYNGFSDNAAGVAMLLAIADVLRRERPARSILFLFFSGEERGLLGSTYYAAQPLIPLARTRAVINLDAGAPPAAPTEWRLAGDTTSAFTKAARDALIARGWTAGLYGATPNSDYWPFLQRAVPAVFLVPGPVWEGVTDAQRTALRARWDRYHRPDDEYSDDFPFVGLARYAEAALVVGGAAAN